MAHPTESDIIKIIAHIHTEFNTKFGVPRQSGIIDSLRGRIVFEPEYRVADALRGIEGFSHLWLIWQFSEARRDSWSPTVRPPRLGGNTRMGVFATRSPFRPNAIGLSSVRLIDVDYTSPDAPAIIVAGAALTNGTPIIDIKPYLPYTDAHPEALGGFTAGYQGYRLEVVFPPDLLALVPAQDREALTGVLAQDPRPSYQEDPERVYGMAFGALDVKFTVRDSVLTVVAVDSGRI